MGMGGGFGIVWYRPLISADPAIPQSAQAREVGEAFLLEEKSREAFVRTAKIPFVAIANHRGPCDQDALRRHKHHPGRGRHFPKYQNRF